MGRNMSKITVAAGIVGALVILTAARAAHAPPLELNGCHDDLDRLRRTASEASDAAEDAQSKREEFEDCRQDSEFNEGCLSKRTDYESALSDLEGKMDDLDGGLQSVQASCEYEFTINRMSAVEASHRRLEAAKRRLCASLQRIVRLGMTRYNALQMCKSNTDEQWCRVCLDLK